MDENLALALAELRGLVEVGFERTNGSTTLILQRLDQVDNRHAELARQVELDRAEREALERRIGELEREAVTRTQLADRTKLIITVVGLMVTIAAAAMTFVQLTRG
ncbi:hypothetical protein ACIBKY_50855 [Nonomuraea sp. NPDC050394]|uniref:hypothetical protein n=1 Tax=Nonomuraea sp. NPDC050394 TaxID=3364363 RepID=UPI0037B4C6B1